MIKSQAPHFIYPDWPDDPRIKAMTTSRKGGVSRAPFNGLNLAGHVGDRDEDISQNRATLTAHAELPSSPFWLHQVHGIDCVEAIDLQNEPPVADASYTQQPKQVLAVLTADCLPILMKNEEASWVAACHAGWRGLLNGVIESTLANYNGNKEKISAWIGPAISKKHFEVGEDVLQLFTEKDKHHKKFFEPKGNNKYWFDYVELAKQQMESMGLTVYGGSYCTFEDSANFYSYRRDGESGRIASLIWIE